jgi:hypothetical protein
MSCCELCLCNIRASCIEANINKPLEEHEKDVSLQSPIYLRQPVTTLVSAAQAIGPCRRQPSMHV